MVLTTKYCTAEDVRVQMGAKSKDDNGIIDGIILAVSRLIDGHMGYKEVGFKALTTPTAKEYTSDSKDYIWIDPCTEVTAVAMKDSVTDTTYGVSLTVGTHIRAFAGDPKSKFVNFNRTPHHGIVLLPNAPRRVFAQGNVAANDGFPLHEDDVQGVFLPTVEVTAKWGYATSVPEPIKQATIMQAERVYKRVQGGMADSLLTGDFGQQRFLSKLDPDVKVLLNMSGLKRAKFVGR